MFGIVQEVIFPLLCHSDADEELWETDPLEYIRVTYGNLPLAFSAVIPAFSRSVYAPLSKRYFLHRIEVTRLCVGERIIFYF